MVYLMNEYIESFPSRKKVSETVLGKFMECDKQFHNMTIAEINEVLSESNPLSAAVIAIYRTAMRNYLEWLRSNGVETNPEIVNGVIFPESQYSFAIYNSDMLHNLWEDFFENHKRAKEAMGKTPRIETYLICYASDILAFYGMTPQQIITLQLHDVSEEGVAGYELPLTERDISVLMAYKTLDTTGNGKKLIGTTYIRTVSGKVSEGSLDSQIEKIKAPGDCTIEMQPVKRNLGIGKVFRLGVYARMYEHEKTQICKVYRNTRTPEWLLDFAKIAACEKEKNSPTFIRGFKDSYIKYREERNSYDMVMTNRAKGTNRESTVNAAILRLNALIATENSPERKKSLEDVRSIVSRLVK